MNHSQENEVEDLGNLHHYRTEIPNIIFHMNLDPLEFKAYCVFKMTAGDKGKCFKSNGTLAEEIGCSIPTVMKVKEQLQEKNLIKIVKRTHASGGSMPDLIQIINIWPENMRKMAEKTNSNFNDGCKPDLQGGINAVNRGCKPGLHKQEHKEQEKKQQQAAPSAAAFFQSKKTEQQQYAGNSGQLPIVSILEKVDIPMRDKIEMTARYDEKTISNAVSWATHKDNPPTKCLSASIKYACKAGLSDEEFNKKHQTPYDKIKKIFKHGESYNNAECFLNKESVAFQRGMTHKQMKLDKFFSWKNFVNMCNELSIQIPTTA